MQLYIINGRSMCLQEVVPGESIRLYPPGMSCMALNPNFSYELAVGAADSCVRYRVSL